MTKKEKALAQKYKNLKLRTPIEWRQVIQSKLTTELQPVAGRIVWWDFFGDLPATQPVNEFNDWLIERSEPNLNVSRLRSTLIKIGYPRHRAVQRLKSFA